MLVTTDSNRHKLNVMNLKGQAVRVIDLRVRIKEDGEKPKAYVTRSGDKGHKLMMLSKPGEIDLVGETALLINQLFLCITSKELPSALLVDVTSSVKLLCWLNINFS